LHPSGTRFGRPDNRALGFANKAFLGHRCSPRKSAIGARLEMPQ
jgi:hypothetical protein